MIDNLNSFTSTGSKLFHHQEAMKQLQNGQGRAIVTHLMITDVCQHTCAFCSVLTREGDSLAISEIDGYLKQLIKHGLKAVIISGGGNPILYRCKETRSDFNDVVNLIADYGLDIGLITNGMPLKVYPNGRRSWTTTHPETLDKCTWIRISMSGLDHDEQTVFIPDIDKTKTTLGFSYVYHDIYHDELETNHGKVSTINDLRTPLNLVKIESGIDRLPWLQQRIKEYVEEHRPAYVRLLPNCLEIDKIADRCQELQEVANSINPDIVFVQYKPPKAPNVCYLGYIHPVLNSDGYVYPCDSCVLNDAAGHKFSNPWRIAHWSEVSKLYEEPIRSLVDPQKLCPGCVFTKTNLLLEDIKNSIELPVLAEVPTHPNFV